MKFFTTYYSKYKIYFKSSLLYFIPSLFAAVVGILINPFMAKNLSPEDYAIMGYFNSFSTIILPLMNFSLITYYLRNYYKLEEERKQIVSDTILITLSVYGILVFILVTGIFYIYANYVNLNFPVYPYVLLAVIPIYFNNFMTFFLVKCRLERDAGKYSKIMLSNSLISALLGVLLVVFYKYGASGRMFATALAALFTGIYCFKQMYNSLKFDITVVKDALRFGWPLSLSAILWYFLSGIDIALLEKLKDVTTLGYYSVALQISGYFAIFYVAIAQTFEPNVYKAIAENHKKKFTKIIIGIVSLNAIPNLIFIILAPSIIGILTYNRYIESSDFAQILALKNITVGFYYSLITIVIGYGFTKSELIIKIIGALICYFMFKILINNYGFYGAAWGQVMSFVILSIICVIFLMIKFKKRKYIKA